MVYSDEGEEVFNFGKHKGKSVEEVLKTEPSYYSWMMQGDFPLYTKRKLEEIHNRWNAKRIAERQPRIQVPKKIEPVENEKTIDHEQKAPENRVQDAVKANENTVKKEFSKNTAAY